MKVLGIIVGIGVLLLFGGLVLTATPTAVDCGFCAGSGTNECLVCFGQGEYTCPPCDGEGGECTICGGDGLLFCSYCNGQGWNTCILCEGKGSLLQYGHFVPEGIMLLIGIILIPTGLLVSHEIEKRGRATGDFANYLD